MDSVLLAKTVTLATLVGTSYDSPFLARNLLWREKLFGWNAVLKIPLSAKPSSSFATRPAPQLLTGLSVSLQPVSHSRAR